MFLRDQVLVYSAIQMLCGIIFWSWAVYNVLKLREESNSVHDNGIDYGIFVFPFLFFAGLNGMTSIRNPHVTIAIKHAKAHVILTGTAHCMVTIAYIIGGITATSDHDHKIYCYVAAVCYALTGGLFTFLGVRWKQSFEKMNHAMSLNMY